MIIVIGAVKGSPGASTTALALTAAWPRPAMLLEADPAGGSLLYRLQDPEGRLLSAKRTLLQLAAEAARDVTPDLVHGYTQHAGGGLRVLLGATDPVHTPVLTRSWPALAAALTRLTTPEGHPMDVIVDAGRWQNASAHLELARTASMLAAVCRPGIEAVAQLRDLAPALQEWRRGPAPLATVVRAPARAAKAACKDMRGELARLQVPSYILGALLEDRTAPAVTGANLGTGDLAASARILAAALAARPAPPQPTAPWSRP